jgi:1-acyl-sn-glycerol-3-phosphate acyltransferase
LRKYLVFSVLGLAWLFSKAFWRREMAWIGGEPKSDPWKGIRVLCFLNHTSLFEWLFIAMAPPRFLWRVACHGVLPAAEKTTSRPIVGQFFKLVGAHVVSISRERDHTWREVLSRIDPDSMVIILPEGRMKRANGLDSKGQPMTVRGGVADILEVIPEGPMLIAYSGGLHHVQAPGERFPRPFRRIRMNFELVEIAAYREAILREARGPMGFKRAVVDDLERRRDLHTPS